MKFMDRFRQRSTVAEDRLREATLALRQATESEALIRERLADLEFMLEDEGWRRVLSGDDRDFSRDGLRKICSLARLMFLKNPLINRAVSIQAVYVWAQGVTVTSSDEAVQQVIDEFLTANATALTGHQARTMAEMDLQTFGNLFFALFRHPSTGALMVRSLPVDEIDDIVTNPDDRTEPWFYRRSWSQTALDLQTGSSTPQQKTAYYPSLHYAQSATERVPSIGGHPVDWDTPVYHVKVGGLSDMRFGVPEVYSAIDWAKAYKSFLEDWASITRAYARFAFKLETKGGVKGITAAKTTLGTTLGSSGSSETNPPPVVGSTFLSSGGADLTPIRTAGATTTAEDGRRLLLMVAAAVGMPETFFGDVSTGNLATAKSLDRPTELKFIDRQKLWADIIRTLIGYAVTSSRTAPRGVARMAGVTDAPPIDVVFPPILEHDVEASVRSIVSGATLDGKTLAGTVDWRTTASLVLSTLGVKNVNEVLDVLEIERAEMEARKAAAAAAAAAAAPQQPTVAEALRDLKSAVEKVLPPMIQEHWPWPLVVLLVVLWLVALVLDVIRRLRDWINS